MTWQCLLVDRGSHKPLSYQLGFGLGRQLDGVERIQAKSSVCSQSLVSSSIVLRVWYFLGALYLVQLLMMWSATCWVIT